MQERQVVKEKAKAKELQEKEARKKREEEETAARLETQRAERERQKQAEEFIDYRFDREDSYIADNANRNSRNISENAFIDQNMENDAHKHLLNYKVHICIVSYSRCNQF